MNGYASIKETRIFENITFSKLKDFFIMLEEMKKSLVVFGKGEETYISAYLPDNTPCHVRAQNTILSTPGKGVAKIALTDFDLFVSSERNSDKGDSRDSVCDKEWNRFFNLKIEVSYPHSKLDDVECICPVNVESNRRGQSGSSGGVGVAESPRTMRGSLNVNPMISSRIHKVMFDPMAGIRPLYFIPFDSQ